MTLKQLERSLASQKLRDTAEKGADMCGRYARCAYCDRLEKYPCANAHNAYIASRGEDGGADLLMSENTPLQQTAAPVVAAEAEPAQTEGAPAIELAAEPEIALEVAPEIETETEEKDEPVPAAKPKARTKSGFYIERRGTLRRRSVGEGTDGARIAAFKKRGQEK